MFRRSWSKIEKCWNPSRWANIISFKESPVVPCLEPCCFMRSNNYLTLGMKSLRHRVEQAILKNSIILLNKKFRDVRLYMRHSYNWKEKGVSFIKYIYIYIYIYKGFLLDDYIQIQSIQISKFIEWSPWCATLSSSSIAYLYHK